jgi:hypothetical protein
VRPARSTKATIAPSAPPQRSNASRRWPPYGWSATIRWVRGAHDRAIHHDQDADPPTPDGEEPDRDQLLPGSEPASDPDPDPHALAAAPRRRPRRRGRARGALVRQPHSGQPVTETGIRAEATHRGLRSRRGRSDVSPSGPRPGRQRCAVGARCVRCLACRAGRSRPLDAGPETGVPGASGGYGDG